ncbi:MAG TPA: hypothetical protein VGW38_14430, partial [Chloroflexota bacterium]|nr:hypothetical protein [Chloroflexota bacterium]
MATQTAAQREVKPAAEVVYFGQAKPGAGGLVIGTVQRVFVDESAWRNGRIDTDVLQPIGRCPGDEYN